MTQLEQAIQVIKDLVESRSTEYDHQCGCQDGNYNDDPGACIHCGVVSYKPHSERCPLRKAEEFLKGLK